MITLVYLIDNEKKDAEIEWLRDQKVFPVAEPTYDWDTGLKKTKIGAIVNKDQALSIKLRHKLAFQNDYKQR